jgi:archaeal flagellar protein FlaF
MAVAELIGAAIGVLLLVMVAYLLVGSTLSTGEIVVAAQKEVTLQQEARLHTSFTLTSTGNTTSTISTKITNTGTEIISDLKHMDVLVDMGSDKYQICSYDTTLGGSTAGKWYITSRNGESIHPFELDPGEVYDITIYFMDSSPRWFQVTTSNGVSVPKILV